MNISDRRKASKHEDGADLISNLPDPIILLILSGLPSTEEIIRTSILSRRWRYLWTSISSLNLSYYQKWMASDKSRKRKFKEFVYSVLLNRSVDLDSFSLFFIDCYSMSTVEQWIHATVRRNVKKLDLCFRPKEESENMVMTHCLVTCASLEVFKLNLLSRGLCLPKVMGFPALRVLHLENIELFGDDSAKDFLERCPLLEDLTLLDLKLDKINLFCISCPKLKKLRLDTLWGCLKISCPKLVFLALTCSDNVIYERLYSLKEAIIELEDRTMHPLFPGISQVVSLDTDLYYLYENLDVACDPALPNLKTLELATSRCSFTAKHLIRIVKHCPELESLCLRVENDDSYDPEFEYGEVDEDETTSMLTPDVRWVESFEINGEKLKLNISCFGRENEWMCMEATWGKEARPSPWMRKSWLYE